MLVVFSENAKIRPPSRGRNSMDELKQLLAVARGDMPADLVIRGGRVLNVFSGQIESVEIAIKGERIAGVGHHYQAKKFIDLNGSFIAPGLIDAHVHIESSLCVPAQFASAIVPRGVTTVVTDPHEIANVVGADGVKFIAEAAVGLPLQIVVMAPSCVPATSMASSGRALHAQDISQLRDSKSAFGLAEVMNFPAVISGNDEMLAKLQVMSGNPIDGHCPAVSGKSLSAYAAAGIGSDHESVTADEAHEKLSRGLYLLIREATNAQNLDTLLPVVTAANSRRICFCTDDRTAGDLLNIGSIDFMLRRAIEFGIDPIEAIRMCTLNPSEWFGLKEIGAIAPGRLANFFVFDDLKKPQARMVFSRGELVAQNGRMQSDASSTKISPSLAAKCAVNWDRVNLSMRAKSDRLRVIGSRANQLVTDHLVMNAKNVDGYAIADPSRDILKMIVIERHHATGNSGVGFIKGFGFSRGAIAGTIAHDHHNLVCIGADDRSMMTAARAVASTGGGLAVCVGENVVAHLPLQVAGLMSDQPIKQVAADYEKLLAAAREIGSVLDDPFMAMSFMALEVIPSLKLTDLGLVDVEKFEIVDLFV
jgi:adenine deaminase